MSAGKRARNTYTPRSMEAGTLGELRPPVHEDPLSEARRILGAASERMEAVVGVARANVAGTAGRRTSRARNAAASEGGRPSPAQVLVRVERANRRVEDALRDVEQAAFRRVRASTGRLALELQEQEQARLAEELHDGAAQALSNAAFHVEIIERAMRSDGEMAARELSALRAQLERDLGRMRGYIHQLRPGLDEPDALDAALTELADIVRSEAGIPVTLSLAAPTDALDVPQRTAVLRVAQEAVQNARKHAGAGKIRIDTRVTTSGDRGLPGWWILEVIDDGVGIADHDQPGQRRRRHFGLRFMRERAEAVGGTLQIESRPAAGTAVRLKIQARERS
jgi:signal transduction histidine kinase